MTIETNITAKVIADSIHGKTRITTLQLKYPRFIHSEFMTHRVFSRNASSSRAIPVSKILKQVWNDPAMPVHWGQNQSGMQAKQELTGVKSKVARSLWKLAGKAACGFAWGMMKIGLHKQIANRILEPWQYIHVVVTATEWDNFFQLRDHPDAQPEIQRLAQAIKTAMKNSRPNRLGIGQWHLPYINGMDVSRAQVFINTHPNYKDGIHPATVNSILKKVSAARCCRVSYSKHDGTNSSIEEDLALCDKLMHSRPIHASPFEHQATPAKHVSRNDQGNFVDWVQYRKLIEKDLY